MEKSGAFLEAAVEPAVEPRKVHELFSSIAPKYDLLNAVLSLGQDRHWRREAVGYLTGTNYTRVFDLAAGTMALTRALLSVNSEVTITALDFSQPMLDRGLEKLAIRWKEQVSTLCADFTEWSPNDPSLSGTLYDGVMCAYGLRNIQGNPVALQKICRLLRPGGRVVILEFFRPDRWATRFFNRTYAQFFIPAIGRLISRHDGAYTHLRDSVRGFYSLDEYTTLLQESGFKIVTARRLTGGISGLIVGDKI